MRKTNSLRLVMVALLATMAFLLTLIKIHPPIFPMFLNLEISDVPGLIASMLFGVQYGIATSLIKNLIDLLVNPVALGIGQLANFIMSSAYIVSFGLICRRSSAKNRVYALGAVCATLIMGAVAAITNYFLLIPAYMNIMGFSEKKILTMAAGNPYIKDMKSLILWGIVPFNLLKGAICSIIGITICRAAVPIISKRIIRRD